MAAPSSPSIRSLPVRGRPAAVRGAALALATVVGVALTVRAAAAADEIHWTLTGQTSVTIHWRGPETTVRYGRYPMAMNDSVAGVTPTPTPDSSPGPFWEARLTGLQENTPYYYRIGNQANSLFRTPPARGGSDFWFAEQGDVGSSLTWPNVTTAQGMLADDLPDLGIDHPRFVLVAGDLAYGDQNGVEDVDQHFNDVAPWTRFAAYMPAWGNHEWALPGDHSPDNLNNYEGRFDLPNSASVPGAAAAVGNGPDDDWYWFDYGNVRFITLPEPFDGGWNDWAAQVVPVMAGAQLDTAITFIVTFGHRPPWSSGADHDGDAGLAGHMASLHASYPKYVLNFSAHSHHYERTEPALTNGIVHIVGSGGGSSLGGLEPNAPAWSAYRINHLHHVRVHVQEDRIDGYAVCGPDGAGSNVSCEAGSVLDAWSILSPALVDVGDPVVPRSGLRVRAEPNPARGSVALRIEADAAGEQSIDILDLSGRRVRHIGDGWYPAGARHAPWDGADAAGLPAPAGIYLVRIRAGVQSATVRVALIR